jgi:hypothetical protein
MKKIVLIALLAGIAIILSTVPRVGALSCAPPKPVKQEMERSSIVFKGKVVDIKKEGLTTFQVEEAWKGVEGSIVEIYDNGWDPYMKNTDYLVFGAPQDGKLKTNLCGRTGSWDQAREEAMKDIDKQPTLLSGVARSDVTGRLAQPGLDSGTFVILVILFVLIVISIVIWRVKKRRTGM